MEIISGEDEEGFTFFVFVMIIILIIVVFVNMPLISFEQKSKMELLIEQKKDFIGERNIVDVIKVIHHNNFSISAIVETPSGRKTFMVHGQTPLEGETWKVEVKDDGKLFFINKIG